VCEFNAIVVIKRKVLFFPELCHGCGGCLVTEPTPFGLNDLKLAVEMLRKLTRLEARRYPPSKKKKEGKSGRRDLR